LFKDGHSPLHLAALCGRSSICLALLKYPGVNVDAADNVGARVVDAGNALATSTLWLPADRMEGRLYT
jgi:ankyrin repeat protein